MRSKVNSRALGLFFVGFGVVLSSAEGCSSGDGGIDSSTGGTAGQTAGGTSPNSGGGSALGGKAGASSGKGGSSSATGGAANHGGSEAIGGAEGGAEPVSAGSGGIPAVGSEAGAGGDNVPAHGGTAGSASGGSGGTLSGSGGTAGSSGTGTAGGGMAGGTAGATSHPACVFHTVGADVGDGGAGGAAPVSTVTSQKNAFVGNYLADGAGKALYVYGADAAGDCNNPPISNCSADCAVSWPPFNGEPRVLGVGLDPSLFGEILRGDGLTQTTYRGWPLYYYKNDLAAGDVKGQAVGKIWHLASLVLPNIVILRVGTIRSLGDGEGHALYASAADTVGSASAQPVSACSGACLQANPAFQPAYASPVSYLNAGDFSFFVRSDGGVQLAYKGAPLYRSLLDTRSGTLNGVVSGWSSVTP